MTTRLSAAKCAFTSAHIDPSLELMQAADAAVEAAEARAATAEEVLETMRPVWAQGWTTDSMAAQASATALAGLWQALGVDNQTAAMQRLDKLIHLEGTEK